MVGKKVFYGRVKAFIKTKPVEDDWSRVRELNVLFEDDENATGHG